MSDAVRVSGPINAAGLEMTLECGKLAQLADGAVKVTVGETTLLSTVCTSKPREGIDFFPLTVDVEERMYAAGKIPGSFFRREGRPGEQAILTCRLTDRPLRPSFPSDFRNEVQVIATILGADMENPHDIASINGASAALTVSGIPFNGPIGAVRLAHRNGEWIAHPTFQEGDEATFEIVVAGRQLDDGDVAIMMVEAGGTEASWELYEQGAPKVTEAVIAQGLEESKRWISAAITLQKDLRDAFEKAHGPIQPVEYLPAIDYSPEVYEAVKAHSESAIADAMAIADKTDRNNTIAEIEAGFMASMVGSMEVPGRFHGEATGVKRAFRSLQKEVTRNRIVNEGVRIDGRGPKDLRALSAEVGVVPTAHGTGLFQRGETQVLSVTTLGMPRMEQMLDTITLDERKRYMHHYNFPPFSTGETGRVGSPKRREIGHGALAERALVPVLPTSMEWPYTMRVVSDVLASNGSTSMASVCGSTLALQDAGVPIKAPVAGIAMGLVFADGKYTTLTDILGAEDAFGDMDFKVAGTADFVTALQLDTKIAGIPADVLAQALDQAKEARLKILEVMNDAISATARRGAQHRAEDHQLRDPERQDRRGDRAQGQGHQRDPAGDRRRHLGQRRERRRPGVDRLEGRPGGRGGARTDPADPRPADARAGRDLHGSGREHHQVRCVHQHPPGPRRPHPHLEARQGQAHRPRRGRPQHGRRARGARRRHRPGRQVVALAGGRRRRRRPGRAA